MEGMCPRVHREMEKVKPWDVSNAIVIEHGSHQYWLSRLPSGPQADEKLRI